MSYRSSSKFNDGFVKRYFSVIRRYLFHPLLRILLLKSKGHSLLVPVPLNLSRDFGSLRGVPVFTRYHQRRTGEPILVHVFTR